MKPPSMHTAGVSKKPWHASREEAHHLKPSKNPRFEQKLLLGDSSSQRVLPAGAPLRGLLTLGWPLALFSTAGKSAGCLCFSRYSPEHKKSSHSSDGRSAKYAEMIKTSRFGWFVGSPGVQIGFMSNMFFRHMFSFCETSVPLATSRSWQVEGFWSH